LEYYLCRRQHNSDLYRLPAVVEPARAGPRFEMPERAVLCFFSDILARAAGELGGREVGSLVSEMGRIPVHAIEYKGQRLAIVQAGVGAPLAAGWMDEMIALGCRAFVAVGGAGVLVPRLALGHVIVPTSAVRDEGTSYHYLPASREVAPTAEALCDSVVLRPPRGKVLTVHVAATWLRSQPACRG